MKKVIIDVDDFGYFSAISLGIIESYKEGILTSTTLMVNMPGRDETIILTKENPDLEVGGHLVLTRERPLAKGTSLIDGSGDFYSLAEYKKHRNEMCDEEIFREWSHQIDYLMGHRLQLAHLDSHHHVHSFPKSLGVTKRIAEKYRLCLRNVSGLEENIELPNQKKIKGFLDLMNHSVIRDLTIPSKESRTRCFEEIRTVLNQVADNEVAGLMVHLVYVDEILYFNSSFNIQQVKGVSVLCGSQMKQFFEENQIVTCSYKNV